MTIENQNKIVKERLHYHFTKLDGTFIIPDNLPFMKEFLNEVSSLCKMVDVLSVKNGETLVSNSICPDCGGEGFNLGYILDSKCKTCNGTGRILERT